MFWKPKKNHAMWDVWAYYNDGTYYLYHLIMGPTERQGWHGQGIAMATSTDGVHWTEVGTCMKKDDKATGLGTGAVWKAGDFDKTGRFICNYSTWFDWCIQSQSIRFAESTDLIHWKKLGLKSDFSWDKQWYEPYPEFPNTARWDCIYPLAKENGKGYYGYWTATPKGRVGFGFGESEDGIHWKSLEPPIVEGTGQGEVGAIEKFGDTYYMMYHGGKGTITGPTPAGPFKIAVKNREVLPGECYFARFFPTPGAMLVVHQSYPRTNFMAYGQCMMAPVKKAVVDAEGTLRLVYWEGNDAVKGKQLNLAPASGSFVTWLKPRFKPERGLVLEGKLNLGGTFPEGPDVGPRPGLSLADTQASGLYIEYEKGRGTYFLCGKNGICEQGLCTEKGGRTLKEGIINRDLTLGPTAKFRLLFKNSMAELYLDDNLMNIFALPWQATGRIGLIGAGAAELAADCRAWEMNLKA